MSAFVDHERARATPHGDPPALAERATAFLASEPELYARSEFLDDIVNSLPVIGYDLAVARAHSGLLVAVRKAGRPRRAHDLIIAATALSTGRMVVTSDRRGFVDLPGVEVRRPT
jgi:tRNA(fMet)-specific endonuclease VapC